MAKKVEGVMVHGSIVVQEIPNNLIPDDFNFCGTKITAEFPNPSKIVITIEKKQKGIGGRSFWYPPEKES